MYVRYYNLIEGIDRAKICRPVELDMEYYKKLWKPNDLWRLATASFNLGISIDCVYDHLVRLMRNVIKQFPDGFIGPACEKFLGDLSGWPLRDSIHWVNAITTQPDFGPFMRPSDSFLKEVPATEKVCNYVINASKAEKIKSGIDVTHVLYEPTDTFVGVNDILSRTFKSCYTHEQ